MKTYQDFEEAVKTGKKTEFIQTAISSHKETDIYKEAVTAEKYYDGENVTINQYQKIVYDLLGEAHINEWSPNHKIASQFFNFSIDQEISYLLRNGVIFRNDGTKERLGRLFDETLADIAQYMRVHGRCFGFWNFDHLEKIKLTEFVPFYDEKTGILRAGIRYWQIDKNKPLNIQLFEEDGYTDYVYKDGKLVETVSKRAYIRRNVVIPLVGKRTEDVGNYSKFPIIQMSNGEKLFSAMHGKRNTIDAFDLMLSGMVNNVDEGTLVYWVLKNNYGMTDDDFGSFFQRLHASHIVEARGEDSTDVVPHAIEAKVDSSQITIEQLNKRLYRDFQAFDFEGITAHNQTATAIKAAYIPLDMKCDKIEGYVTKFILELLELVGIENEAPKYARNKLLNEFEETQKFVLGADFTGMDYVTEKLLIMNGDIDSLEKIKDTIAKESMKRNGLNGADS